MSSAPIAKPTQQIALPPQRASLSAAVEECLERTATLLLHVNAATKSELIEAVTTTRKANSAGRYSDLLEILSRQLGHSDEELANSINGFAEKISHALIPTPPLIPFASKFITPAAFYDNFPELRSLGHALLSPIIYAEDSDAIGTAALNPVAATIMAEEITAAVTRRFNIRPFVSSVLLDYPNWSALVRKHFVR